MVKDKEKVVRLLFPNKILHGRIMGSAFALRPHRKEASISVFRMAGPTFIYDIEQLDAGRNSYCSVMAVEDVRSVRIFQGTNTLDCDVVETELLHATSHAGIVVYINGTQLVGGQEGEISIFDETGESLEALVLAMQHRLASLAQKGLARVNDVISIARQ